MQENMSMVACQSHFVVSMLIKLITGVFLLTSVAAGRALQAPAQNSNLLPQNGRRLLSNGQNLLRTATLRLPLGQFFSRTLAAQSKKILHKKPAHNTPSKTETKHKVKSALKPASTIPPNVNSRQQILIQVNNEFAAADLNHAINLDKVLPVYHTIINQVASTLNAEAKDRSMHKNDPQMLNSNNILDLCLLLDSVSVALSSTALYPRSHNTQQQITDARRYANVLLDLKLKAEAWLPGS